MKKIDKHFFRIEHEYNSKMLCVLIPTLWFDTYNKGLQVRITRISLSFLRGRVYFDFGKLFFKRNVALLFIDDKNTSKNKNEYANISKEIDYFIKWGKNWHLKTIANENIENSQNTKNKKALNKIWNKNSFLLWLKDSSYKDIVLWRGINYHYSRIILFNEYIAYCKSNNQFSINENNILENFK